MTIIKLPNGRGINKVMSIVFAVFTVISIIAAIVVSNYDLALGETFCILAAIFLLFLILFLIMWFICYLAERKKQKQLSTSSNHVNIISNNSYEAGYATFELPYEELLSAARKRYYDGMKGASAISICFAGIFLFSVIKYDDFDGIRTIATIFVIMLFYPAICFVLQFPPYDLYKRTIPHKIAFKPSLLTIDEKQYYARDISELIVSSEQRKNNNSITFYRTLTVYEGSKKDVYRVDFRAQGKGSIRYDDYGKLVQYMQQWCQINGVKLTINYMD